MLLWSDATIELGKADRIATNFSKEEGSPGWFTVLTHEQFSCQRHFRCKSAHKHQILPILSDRVLFSVQFLDDFVQKGRFRMFRRQHRKHLIRFMNRVVKKTITHQIPQKITEFSDLSKLTENLSYHRSEERFWKISWVVKMVKFLW